MVIGRENKTVLVKHGGEYVRVHPVSLIHVKKVEFINPVDETESNTREPINSQNDIDVLENSEEEDDESVNERNIDKSSSVQLKPDGNKEVPNSPVKHNLNSVNNSDKPKDTEQFVVEEIEVPINNISLPNINSKIIFKIKETDDMQKGLVHS